MNTRRQQRWSTRLVVFMAVLVPFLMWGAIVVLPTFDDWTSLVAPQQGPFLTKERFLFYGNHWRPFDSTMGYLAGLNPQKLFPTLHHVCVVLGHLGSTTLLFLIGRMLMPQGKSLLAVTLATVFFFITPGMMATVTAVDGLNQTYSAFWSLLATLIYLAGRGRLNIVLWVFFVFVATLCKENGIMWMLIPPLLAYGFGRIDRPTLCRHLLIGGLMMALYALSIVLLPSNIEIVDDYVPGVGKTLANFVKFVFTTWVTVDYVSLLHAPSRNWPVVALSLLFSLPFLLFLVLGGLRMALTRRVFCLVTCHLLAVAPHVGTIFSMMHTYAGLALAALLVAVIADTMIHLQAFRVAFLAFVCASLAIDVHLWHASWKSGLTGKKMALEAIQKTGQRADSVKIIIIEDDYPRLSSFCVVPSDAFGWGLSARYETNYQWPAMLSDTTIERTSHARAVAERMGREWLRQKKADCVWVVDHAEVSVLK